MRLARGRNSSDRKRSRSRPSPASTTVSRMWESNLVEHNRRNSEKTVDSISCASSTTSTGRASAGIDVGLPALAQHLGAGPAVVGTQFDAEQVAHLAIEIGEIGLGPAAHADLDVTLLGEPLGENPQGDRLAGAGRAGDEGEAAFADQLLDAPAERRDARRDMKRLHRHVGNS